MESFMRSSAYILFIFILFSSCSVFNKSEISEADLFSINGEPILADEFEYVYEKNNFNNDSVYLAKDVENYFQLFVNFKLKVAEAKALGLDTTKTFIDEYTSYKDQLIRPYLSEVKEQERLVLEAYDRMNYEVDASHILVTVGPDATPKDTLAAYQSILEVYEKAQAGEDFNELALTYSQDPSAKSNMGRLGYFTAFQMVFPFEEAAYTTAVDSISNIIRSRFGYHILKVNDKRPYSGKVKISHIMLTIGANQSDTLATRNKIFEIHDQIEGGVDWDDLCQRYSQDQRTKNSGGTLPFISLGQINDEAFETVAFGLQATGEISDPVRSRYGWHIIRLEEKMGLQSFEEMKSEIEAKVAKDERSMTSKAAAISNLKKQNEFIENEDVKNQLIQTADSTIIAGEWVGELDQSVLIDTLFFIDGRPYLVSSLSEHVLATQSQQTSLSPADYMTTLINDFIDQKLLEYEEQKLIETNRDFRLLLKEYYEGILLFEIMNQKVWQKAIEDTLGLRSFFKDHQESYYWGKRAAAAILTSPNRTTIESVKSALSDTTFQLREETIDIEQSKDNLSYLALDTLISIFDRYDDSWIVINPNSITLESEVFSKVVRHFKNMGVPESDIIIQERNRDAENIITITLNSSSKKSLEYLYNQESGLNLQVTEQLFEKGENQSLDSLTWEEGIYDVSKDETYILVAIDQLLEEQPKKLKDVKGLVISDYQNYLEKNWVAELRSSNAISINYKTLENIKKAYGERINSTD